jgi:ferredoxin
LLTSIKKNIFSIFFYRNINNPNIFATEITLKLTKMAYKIGEDCTACGSCKDECPVEAISEGDIYKIDPDVCTDCGACADVCPVECIKPE